jgi:pimeloyl-ACP methyl ester carboxylesterase
MGSDQRTVRTNGVDLRVEALSVRTTVGNEDVGGSNARSDQITVPTLVLHGTADPLFPYDHGVALAEAIPGARLVAMDGVGHAELPPAVWDVVVPAIVGITSGAAVRD